MKIDDRKDDERRTELEAEEEDLGPINFGGMTDKIWEFEVWY